MPTPFLPSAATRSHTRRVLAAALAGIPLASAIGLRGAGNAAAKKRKSKKVTLCLNGQTIKASKKKKKKLLKQGATAGACAPAPTPPACDCASSQRCCNNACVTPRWANQTTFGSGPGNGVDQLTSPTGVSVQSDTRTLVIGDPDNNRVSVWARPSATSLAWSAQSVIGDSAGGGSTQLLTPTGLALAADGLAVWIADTGNSRISVWTRSSATSSDWANAAIFGSGPGSLNSQFDQPNGVAISPDTLTAFVADTGNSRVSVWTRPDTASTTWSYDAKIGSGPGSGATQFSQPFGLAVSPDTLTLWVADTNNDRISVWGRSSHDSPDWNHLTTFGSTGSSPNQLDGPVSVTVAADTRTVWIADSSNDRVSIWTRATAASTAWSNLLTFGETGSGPNQFGGPKGVAIAPDAATVWITDFINDRISVWTATCPA